MYHCNDCEEWFDEPDVRVDREADGLDSPPYRESRYETCPYCQSDDIRDVEERDGEPVEEPEEEEDGEQAQVPGQ